ncbi:MAG: DUF1385 domain-containing protein [Phototrophicales bacterium]|nr:MAG: DUF1385 domain-containing protein [Phototrophicales bacterium]
MEAKAPKQFSYGGQAVIEGVMMRGAHKAAVAVRKPSEDGKGAIVIHEQPLNATLYRGWISKTPFVRGLVGLWDALGLGTRALLWSADVAMAEEDKDGTPADGDEKKDASSIFNGPLGYGTLAVSLAIGVGLFFLLPTSAATGIEQLLGLQAHPFLVNLIEGVIQLTILIVYISLISLMPDVKRLFGYHGAEHKTINAYEAGAELTPEVVAQYPIEHPRCGTAFLLTVAFVSVLVFSLFGRPPFLLLILSRIVLIPVIAGIAYEVIRFTAKHMHNPIVRVIVIPNLALQHLTTRQPDLGMIEVAIAAFKRVLVSESVIQEPEPSPAVTASAD